MSLKGAVATTELALDVELTLVVELLLKLVLESTLALVLEFVLELKLESELVLETGWWLEFELELELAIVLDTELALDSLETTSSSCSGSGSGSGTAREEDEFSAVVSGPVLPESDSPPQAVKKRLMSINIKKLLRTI